jgi:hypothetical protein
MYTPGDTEHNRSRPVVSPALRAYALGAVAVAVAVGFVVAGCWLLS